MTATIRRACLQAAGPFAWAAGGGIWAWRSEWLPAVIWWTAAAVLIGVAMLGRARKRKGS